MCVYTHMFIYIYTDTIYTVCHVYIYMCVYIHRYNRYVCMTPENENRRYL